LGNQTKPDATLVSHESRGAGVREGARGQEVLGTQAEEGAMKFIRQIRPGVFGGLEIPEPISADTMKRLTAQGYQKDDASAQGQAGRLPQQANGGSPQKI
jgi:hypothetical protein